MVLSKEIFFLTEVGSGRRETKNGSARSQAIKSNSGRYLICLRVVFFLNISHQLKNGASTDKNLFILNSFPNGLVLIYSHIPDTKKVSEYK